MARARTEHFTFLGAHPCLDFVNTVPGGDRAEALHNFDDLLEWLSQARLLSRAELNEAGRRSAGRPEAQRIYRDALLFREHLLAMLERVISGQNAPEPAMAAINRFLSEREGHQELIQTKSGFAQEFRRRLDRPSQLLAPIAESASDLLCNHELNRIKRCANPTCGLFFLEIARNRQRRWCSMKTCGNRAKLIAFRRRQRLAGRRTDP